MTKVVGEFAFNRRLFLIIKVRNPVVKQVQNLPYIGGGSYGEYLIQILQVYSYLSYIDKCPWSSKKLIASKTKTMVCIILTQPLKVNSQV